MPRYRNKLTGVVVDVPESLAVSIGSYEPVDAAVVRDESATESPKRRSRKSDDD